MKKNIFKFILLIVGILISAIIYLSVVGIETESFNNQIKDKINQTNNKLDLKLKKIKLTLDPLNFKITAKTIGTKIIYQKKILELEYIKTQISLNSLIENKFVSSDLEISTRSILLKDGKIDFSKDYNFEKINISFDIKNSILNFNDINFKTKEIAFISNNLKVTQNNNNFIFEGVIENKNTALNNELINIKKFEIQNINLDSKNKFSFKIDKKFKIKDLVIDSKINLHKLEYKKPDLFNDYLPKTENIFHFKDHKITLLYKKNNFSGKGLGKVKFEKEFDEIEYVFVNKDKDFSLTSNIFLTELNIKNQKFLKSFFFFFYKDISLKDHKVKIDYKKNNLTFNGSGNIKIDQEFDRIDYSISKIINKFNFNIKLDLDNTLLKINYLNYEKDKTVNANLSFIGSYEKNVGLNLDKISIFEKDNRIILNNFLLNNENKILKIDKADLDYFDVENKKNQFLLERKKNDNYELKGSIFNANSLISNLLKSKENDDFKIFKNDINLSLKLSEVYIDNKNYVRNLKGDLKIKDNKVFKTNISAFFDNKETITYTIYTNENDEKITTLFSSRAKPLVKRYKFIKGYEEGYLDFYSSKKNKISNSTLKIYDFKLQELPILTKLLTLASLQGIADLLSGEGIRFDELEMSFVNQGNLMTISELYAIGPAISILIDGYMERDKLISLRGTLVPATTINKTIGSIPILGKILVGKKMGEGVFGGSFKIKGPPKDLKTFVNPIKTLTPRFITRTLEKIKKN